MKTHENRALFSKAVLKATTCLFLAAGASVSPAFAFPGTAGCTATDCYNHWCCERQEWRNGHWCQRA